MLTVLEYTEAVFESFCFYVAAAWMVLMLVGVIYARWIIWADEHPRRMRGVRIRLVGTPWSFS